jgi:hypothetical protein
MATISQIRGMLLEAAVLQLLRTAGYVVVEKAGSDPTLHDGHSGLETSSKENPVSLKIYTYGRYGHNSFMLFDTG